MTRVVLRSDGTTTCCNAPTTTDECCSNCHRPVQVRIVKEGDELTMIAGAQPCVSFNYRPKRRPQPRNVRTTARRGRGKSSKR